MNKPHSAVICPGCGARAAYTAGVLSTLPQFDLAVGTSAGALCCLAHVHRTHAVWLEIKKRSDVITRNLFPIHSIFDPAPLVKLISRATQSVPQGEAVVTVTDLATSTVKYYSNQNTPIQDLRKMVLASASIPGAFPPVDKRYVDGGVKEVAPLKYAIDRGATMLTLILGENLALQSPPRRLENIIDTCVRTLDVMIDNVMKDDLAAWKSHPNRSIGLRIIQPPPTHYYDTLDFTEENITRAYNLGRSWQSHNPDKFEY